MTSLTEGMTLHSATTLLAEIIRVSPRPLTQLLEDLAGIEISFSCLDDGRRELTETEKLRLSAQGFRKGRYRLGMLTSDFLVARTGLVWLEQRTPWSCCQKLNKGNAPAGKIMAEYGMHRDDRLSLAVYPGEGDIAVRSSAALFFGDVPAGIAYEAVTVSYCQAWRRNSKLPLDYGNRERLP